MTDDFGSFKWLTGDVNYTDYGGKWCRTFGHRADRCYHIIELFNWAEVDGKVEYTYNCSLSEVDLAAMPDEAVFCAMQACGLRFDNVGSIISGDGDVLSRHGDSPYDLILVECLHQHGNKAPLWEDNGNNWRKLMREARAYSRALLLDDAAHEDALERPVNALGTSARNYMLGRLVP